MLRKLLTGLILLPAVCHAQTRAYVGFDKNDYPGDELLPALHKTFTYTGYWLNNPPGMTSNPWVGKRDRVRAAGFGFLILFNGRLDADLKGQDAAALGKADAQAAFDAALRENFPAGSIIFLDQEEGGRLFPEQAAYVGAWIDTVSDSDFRAGIYCSGVAVPDGAGSISTAQDVQRFAFPTINSHSGYSTTSAPRPPGASPMPPILQKAESRTRWYGSSHSRLDRRSPPPAKLAMPPTTTAMLQAFPIEQNSDRHEYQQCSDPSAGR